MLRITKPDGTEEMKKVFILKNEITINSNTISTTIHLHTRNR